jgi:hypothetical protein
MFPILSMFHSESNFLGRLLQSKKEPSHMEEIKLMPEEEDIMPVAKGRRNSSRLNRMVLLLSTAMFVLGLIMVVSTLNYKQSDKSCAAQLSIWCKASSALNPTTATDALVTLAPLLQAVDYEQRDWESIFTQKHSIWTGAPTPELEDRWHKLVNGIYPPHTNI